MELSLKAILLPQSSAGITVTSHHTQLVPLLVVAPNFLVTILKMCWGKFSIALNTTSFLWLCGSCISPKSSGSCSPSEPRQYVPRCPTGAVFQAMSVLLLVKHVSSHVQPQAPGILEPSLVAWTERVSGEQP